MADITKPADQKAEQETEVVVVQPVKHWWQSRVIWFNAFVILAGLITNGVPSLEKYMTPESFALLNAIMGVVNMALRLNTSKGIIKRNTPIVNDEGET